MSKIHISRIVIDTLEKLHELKSSISDILPSDMETMAGILESNIALIQSRRVGNLSGAERQYVSAQVASCITFLKANVKGMVRHEGDRETIEIVKRRIIPTLEKFRTVVKNLDSAEAVAATESLTVQLSKLTTKSRNELKDDQFALPGRRYPIPDKRHAQDAKARAKQMLDKGYLSKSEYDMVVERADKVLNAE